MSKKDNTDENGNKGYNVRSDKIPGTTRILSGTLSNNSCAILNFGGKNIELSNMDIFNNADGAIKEIGSNTSKTSITNSRIYGNGEHGISKHKDSLYDIDNTDIYNNARSGIHEQNTEDSRLSDVLYKALDIIEKLNLSSENAIDLRADIDSVQAQLNQQNPITERGKKVIKGALLSIKSIFEGAGGIGLHQGVTTIIKTIDAYMVAKGLK